MVIFWATVFVISLIFLVKGADWLLDSSDKIGRAAGLSPFIIGVLIVGLGTSLPELASSIAAIIADTPEIVTANAIGSNIANIFLVIGLAAVVGGGLGVSKNLIDLDIPLLAIATALFTGIAIDQNIVFGEAIILIALVAIYITYVVQYSEEKMTEEKSKRPKVARRDILFFFIGLGALIGGAKYLIDSVVAISVELNVAVSVISLVAVAFGTSLPELIVSLKAAVKGQAEVALGNIFGSNVFNLLIVVGVPGLFATLPIDDITFMLALPTMVAATLLFLVSGISRKVHPYEGAMYLVFYLFFLGKIFGII